MKESFTINKPHIAEDFIAKLMSGVKEEDSAEGEKSETITLSREHLNYCLNQLASNVMQREKHNYEK